MNKPHHTLWLASGLTFLLFGCNRGAETTTSAFKKVIPPAHSVGFIPTRYVSENIGRDSVVVFQLTHKTGIDPIALGWSSIDAAESDAIASEAERRLTTQVPRGGKAFFAKYHGYACRLYLPPDSNTGYIVAFGD